MASRFIKPKALRAHILETAALRHKKWTRVALNDWLNYVNRVVANLVDKDVMSAPTLGKTLYPPTKEDHG